MLVKDSTDMFQPTCSDRHDSIDRVLSFYQLSANVNWLWSWLYRPLEIRTKVRLDPQKNRPDFYNLINAQPTRRQCIQHKINNSILLPLMMHQNFWSEVGTGSTKWWSTSSVVSMAVDQISRIAGQVSSLINTGPGYHAFITVVYGRTGINTISNAISSSHDS